MEYKKLGVEKIYGRFVSFSVIPGVGIEANDVDNCSIYALGRTKQIAINKIKMKIRREYGR